MKKYILLLFVVVMSAGVASAQTPIRLAPFLGYGSDVIKQTHVGFLAEFMINSKMAISPDLILYFPKINNYQKQSWYELDGNFNYYFVQEKGFHLYGLAGLNYTRVKYRDTRTDRIYGDDGRIGINLGFGMNFVASRRVLPFIQMKYVVSDYDHAAISAGIKFQVN